MKNIVYVGIDVDDNAFHGHAVENDSEKTFSFTCRPNVAHLVKKLNALRGENGELKICYESTYLGFSLQRDLSAHGWHCDVIASSLIPKKPGKFVKTDKIDCRSFARNYRNGELSIVHVPDAEEECVRSIVRSRKFLKEQSKELKRHILSACRCAGIHYRTEEGKGREYWTAVHREWLSRQTSKHKSQVFQFNIHSLLMHLKQVELEIGCYEKEIARLAQSSFYKKKVDSLRCYRGLDTLSSMTLITEIGDISRFAHPRKLCSYAGMDLREYSSGGKEHRFSMSKMGNRHIRTGVIEACQSSARIPRVSKRLKEMRKGTDERYIAIADRCMKRLHQKSSRLLCRGKEKNKVKVACGRELLCFIWESLRGVDREFKAVEA